MRLVAIHNFGDTLYLNTRDEALRGKVVAVVFVPSAVVYRVSWGNGETSEHYGFELSHDYSPAFTADGPDDSLADADSDSEADADA